MPADDRKGELDEHEVYPRRPIHCRAERSIEHGANEQQNSERGEEVPAFEAHWFRAPHRAGERCGNAASEWVEPRRTPIQPEEQSGDVQDEINEIQMTSIG